MCLNSFSRKCDLLSTKQFYKIFKIVRALSLVDRCVKMGIYKHALVSRRELFHKSNRWLFFGVYIASCTLKGLGEFSKVMQTQSRA